MAESDRPIISVRDLRKHFEIRKGFFGRAAGTVRAVDGVTFDIHRGEVFGLVGESGCGKSTLGMTILRGHKPTSGEVVFRPKEGSEHGISDYSDRDMRPLRRDMQIIFQDPFSSLSPRMTVRDIVAEPLQINHLAKGREVDEAVAALLEKVGLNPLHMRRYPHAFSGGQRQRISIARALVMNPSFVVADEAVSALDVSVRAQTLELLRELKREFELTYLFISHDLSVINYFCDRVAVMYVGKIVEQASTDEVFRNPLHPYTEALTSAIPIADPEKRRQMRLLPGEVADPASPPTGCLFHPRCKYAKEICSHTEPELRLIEGDHYAACHFAGSLGLESILKGNGDTPRPVKNSQGGVT